MNKCNKFLLILLPIGIIRLLIRNYGQEYQSLQRYHERMMRNNSLNSQKTISLNSFEAEMLVPEVNTTESHIRLNTKSSIFPLGISSERDDFSSFQAINLLKCSRSKPLQVYLPAMTNVNTASVLVHEFKHFVYDGIVQSPFLNLTTIKDNADVLIAQTFLEFSKKRWCRRFAPFVHDFIGKQKSTPKTVILMDWQDHVEILPCYNFKILRGEIFYTKRSIVRGRAYLNETGGIQLGWIDSFKNWTMFASSPVRHTPYAVRSDVVKALESVLIEKDGDHGNKKSNRSLLHWDVVNRDRTRDVAHFWPWRGKGVDRGGKFPNSILRDTVSQVLEDMLYKNSSLRIFTDLMGKANLVGRFSVDPAYAQALLDFKIVVVTQKDTHEDHYRLMEALVSGAMVMSDVMLSIPTDFEDGKSIVFYRNMNELRTKVMYYLQNKAERLSIAKMGWTIAMNRHRSWHRMEEVLFGKVLSSARV
jgi:Glycosyl transferases group 1